MSVDYYLNNSDKIFLGSPCFQDKYFRTTCSEDSSWLSISFCGYNFCSVRPYCGCEEIKNKIFGLERKKLEGLTSAELSLILWFSDECRKGLKQKTYNRFFDAGHFYSITSLIIINMIIFNHDLGISTKKISSNKILFFFDKINSCFKKEFAACFSNDYPELNFDSGI